MYVILGASGRTGSVVAEALLAKGEKVRVVGRSKERLAGLVALGAEAIVADQNDAAALTRAFEGARAVYFMVPPMYDSTDYLAFQRQLADAAAIALEAAKVKYVVALSSYGAEQSSGSGPISGLFAVEARLRSVPALNVLFLRAGFFMENIVAQIPGIKYNGAMGTSVRAGAILPMIATHDIGAAAADAILKLDFSGHEVRELQGERDLTYPEVARIVGAALGKPDMEYRELPRDQFGPILLRAGFSQNFTDIFLEMNDAINAGRVRALELRSAKNSTPTSLETFVKDVFLPAYRGQAAVA